MAPDWVSFGAEKTDGLDLLGLRAPVQRIGNDLFDGITTVTPKVRYLSVLTWIMHRYSQARLPNGWAQFFRFAAGAVLVAHNAAFDMMAIGRAAAACGLAFDHPVLDTLLISAWLDPEETDHSVDGIAARMDLSIAARHNALGDALIEAAILVRQFERLEARGIDQFGPLAVAIDLSARLRQHRMAF